MMPVTDIFGLASCAFVAAVVLIALLPMKRQPVSFRVGAAFVCLGLMFVPVNGLMIAGYVRGVIADPSATTMLLTACIAARQFFRRELFDAQNLGATMALILLAGTFLYPMALGLGPYDPYALGYGSWIFYGGLVLIALAAWWCRLYLPMLCIALGVAMFVVGLTESTNLWNTLIDPIAVVLAAGWFIERAVRLALHRRRSTGAVE